MKLSILLAGRILNSAIVGNAYAQTCGAQPSCADLGYSYTGSTSDCVGPALKCPFNTSYFNCVKKADALAKLQADIVTAAMPNYKTLYSRATGVTYTTTTNGFLIGIDYRKATEGGSVEIWINNSMVRVQREQTDWTRNSWSYPIQKGSTYRVSISGSTASYYFAPTI